jgi:hypothetical protein
MKRNDKIKREKIDKSSDRVVRKKRVRNIKG